MAASWYTGAMYAWAIKSRGFTIVELLIVIVVIAILAAITIVAYSGMQDRARASSLQADVSGAVKTLEAAKITSGNDTYPNSASAAGLKASGSNTVNYYFDSDMNSYCVEYSNGGSSYSASSIDMSVTKEACTTKGLIGWWRFNGNANDTVGNNNGAITNATLTVGQSGASNSAYAFNGSARIDLASNYTSKAPNSVTKSIWVNLTSNPYAYSTIFDIGNPGNGQSDSMYIETSSASNSGVMIGAKVESGGNAFAGRTNQIVAPMSFGSWHHVVQVVSRNYMKTYVDGALTNTMPGAYLTTPFSYAPTFGHGRGPIIGTLDDARLYNRPLSQGEITALYQSGAE